MLSLNGLKHIIAQPIGWGAQAVGAVTPGSTGDRLTTIGHSITNPDVVYSGPLNPLDSNFRASGGQNWAGNTSAGAAAAGGADTQVQAGGAQVPGSGIYDGAGAYDPNTDPRAIGSLKGQIGGLMQLFQAAYDSVVSKIDEMATAKKADVMKAYDTQGETLGKNFANASQSIDNIMFGQGSGNSSYEAKQQGTARDAYDTAVNQLGTNKTNDLGQVGQYADVAKAQISASKPNYDVNNYNTVSDLQTISDAVNQALGQLRVTSASTGTPASYVASLDKIAPTQETGSSQLKSQLDKLASVNAPDDAKAAIAQTIVDNAGGDPAWLDYFNKVLAQTGSAATPDAVATPVAG